MIFDKQGRVKASSQLEHTQYYPQPGWVEHDGIEILQKTRAVIAEGLAKAGISFGDLAAIGITNQRETSIIWDRKTGKPIHNAIVWQDIRTAKLCADIDAAHGKIFRERTGLPAITYFSASKIRWLLDNVPGARQAAKNGDLLFGTIDTWLLWNLSGGAGDRSPSKLAAGNTGAGLHVTDATNASRTLLMNLKTLDWDDELLSIWDIPKSLLPKIRPSSEVYGMAQVSHALAGAGIADRDERIRPQEKDGASAEVPIAALLGDQQAALFGQTCFNPGDAKNTYGTGCFLLMNTGEKPIFSTHGLLTTVAYHLPGKPVAYGLEGSVAMAGASVQWLRDNLGIIKTSAEIESLAASVSDNGDVYFVPAFSGLFAPYWSAGARGVVTGLTRYAHKGHIARAVLESTAYQTRDLIEAMEKDSGNPLKSLRVDGGMSVNSLLMQFQADILDTEVQRPVVNETTALGAAYAAGLATGFFRDTQELSEHWNIDRSWKPGMTPETRKTLYEKWKRAIGKSLDWADEH